MTALDTPNGLGRSGGTKVAYAAPPPAADGARAPLADGAPGSFPEALAATGDPTPSHERHAQPRLMPGKQGDAPNGSTQVASYAPDAFGLDDLIDIVNPLQHIPVVSTIYRALTGDQLNPVARVVGGALFGGPVGLALGVGNALVEQASGRDVGENAIAMVAPDMAPAKVSHPTAPTAIAEAAHAAPARTAAAAPAGQPHPAAQTAATATATATGPTTASTGAIRAFPRGTGTLVANAAGSEAATRTDGPPPAALAAAKALPEMSPEAFDALMKSIGAVPETGPHGAARPAQAAQAAAQAAGETSSPAPSEAPATARATPPAALSPTLAAHAEAEAPAAEASNTVAVPGGATPAGVEIVDGRRFFPANRVAPPPPRTVQLPVQGKPAYDEALAAMRAALDKYQGQGRKDAAAALGAGAGAGVEARL